MVVDEGADGLGASRSSSRSTSRRSRTSTRSPTSGTATTRSPGPSSRARCCARSTAPTCFATSGNGSTEVTYRLALDVSIPLIGMLKRKGEKILIDTALKGLKKRVESPDACSLRVLALHRQGRGRQVHRRGRDRGARRGRRPPDAGAVHRRRALARRRVRRSGRLRAHRGGRAALRAAGRRPAAVRAVVGRDPGLPAVGARRRGRRPGRRRGADRDPGRRGGAGAARAAAAGPLGASGT